MFPQRYGIFLMLMLTTTLLEHIHAQCVINKTKTTPDFPDPTKLYALSGGEYQLKIEVNDKEKMQSAYVTEYCTKILDEGIIGRLDSHFKGERKMFLYKTNTNETFTFTHGFQCESKDIRNVTPPFEDFNVYDWNCEDKSGPIYGPFCMLSKGYDDKKNMEFEGPKTVRGLKANVWKRCADGGKLAIRYMLLDENESIGIKGQQSPLRITVEGEYNKENFSQSYEFVHFQLSIEDHAIFSIPFNKGCQLQAKEPENMGMKYRQFNYAYEAELVYTSIGNEDTHMYINNLKTVYDNTSELYAYSTIPWKAHKDSTFADAGHELFRVFDVKNGYLYELDFSNNDCKISSKSPDESKTNLYLPDGNVVSLLDPNIIDVNEDTAQEFIYLGTDTVRGKKVDVYEKTWVDELVGKYITTHYYLSDEETVISERLERNTLIKVVYIEDADTLPRILIFNFYQFHSLLTHKQDIFDVSVCFKKEDQSEWFQVIYSTQNIDAETLQEQFPKIREKFFKSITFDHIVTPVRIPKILVDIDGEYLYITVTLLERVPAKLDFKLEGSGNIRLSGGDVSVGLTTEEGCFQACVNNKKCKMVNYCGVNCVLSFSNYTAGSGTTDKDCVLYKRVKESSQKTIEEVNKRMKEEVGTGRLNLIIKDQYGNDTTIFAKEVKTGVAFGLNNYDGTNNKIDSSFSVFKSGYNIKKADSSATHSFMECQQECLRDPQCESLAFCQFSSICGFSKIHGEDIGKINLEQDDKCIILSRNYAYEFNEFPGVNMVRKAEAVLQKDKPEGCAKACLESEGFTCRSFDLCGNPGQRKCYLHSAHVIDSKGQDVDQSNCVHYSRNYVFDFTIEKGMALLESVVPIQFQNVEAVEECARYCTENADCKSFDFCRKPFQAESQCYLSKTLPSKDQVKIDPNCNLYRLDVGKSDKTDRLLSPFKMDAEVEHLQHKNKFMADEDVEEKNVKVIEVIDDTGYSKSLTGGIAFFLFLVGIAVGAAAMFGYGYYKANRKV